MGAAVGGRGNLGPAGGRGAGGWGYNPPSSALGSPASASWVNRSQGHGSPRAAPRGQPLGTEPGREGQGRGLEGQVENNTQHGKDGTEREEQNHGEMGLERDTKFKGRDRNAKVLGQGEGGDSAKQGPSAGAIPCSLALLSLQPEAWGPG